MSLYSLNIKPKCYKVVCNLLDPEQDYSYQNHSEEINDSNYLDKLSLVYNNHTTPDNIKQMVFVFVGEYNDDIKIILDNILNSFLIELYNLLCIADITFDPLSKRAIVVPTAAFCVPSPVCNSDIAANL